MDSPEILLKKLGLSDSEALVYVAMLEGHLKVKDIMQITGMKRPSVYYAISQLMRRGLIGRIQVGEYNQWKVSPLSRLEEMLNEKQEDLDTLSNDLTAFIDSSGNKVSESENAKVTYYEGKRSIQAMVFNSLYCKDKQILSIAPSDNFFFQAGKEFATKYVSERKRRGIRTRNLWEELLEPKILQETYKNMSEIRILPKEMRGKFTTTVFIYDHIVMYIAPFKSNYAVTFESAEHRKMLTAMFETIWTASKPAFK